VKRAQPHPNAVRAEAPWRDAEGCAALRAFT